MHLIGDADMCTVFEAERKDGIIEGRIEGRAEGRTEGLAEGIIAIGHECGLLESDILTKLQEKLDISSQKAQEYLQQFGKS
jgi:flagellar biosynthesis/type III secretory pathway protein FliH